MGDSIVRALDSQLDGSSSKCQGCAGFESLLNHGYMCNLLHAMQLYSAHRPSGAKIIASNKLNKLRAIILGSGQGYRCQSVCDW